MAHPLAARPRIAPPTASCRSTAGARGSASTVCGAIVAAALDRLPDLPEWLPPALLQRRAWPGWAAGDPPAHRPRTPLRLEPHAPARQRLAFDELLAGQLALAADRAAARAACPAARSMGDGSLRTGCWPSLPFPLTACQNRAVAEIARDLAAPAPMLRLLQGDVGSGKTVVALAACCRRSRRAPRRC